MILDPEPPYARLLDRLVLLIVLACNLVALVLVVLHGSLAQVAFVGSAAAWTAVFMYLRWRG